MVHISRSLAYRIRLGFVLLCIQVVLALLILNGCAGSQVAKLSEVRELPTDLPPDVREKFEVKDSPNADIVAPQPNSATVALTSPTHEEMQHESQSKTKHSKHNKHKRSGKNHGPELSHFVYPVRRLEKDPIWQNEKEVYEITYFGMAAGDFTLEVLPYKIIADRKVYHIRGTAISSKVFNFFYRLNDTVESFIDYDGMFSHRFHLLLDETKQARDSLELYDSEKRQTYYWNRWNHRDNGYKETRETDPMEPFSQDSLSALYYLRIVPLPDGGVVSFPVVSEGKSWEAVVTVVRREAIDTPMGRVNTVVVKPETKYQGVMQKKGDSFLWLTDDDRRIVVRLEAKVRVGTVVARLKSVNLGTSPVQ